MATDYGAQYTQAMNAWNAQKPADILHGMGIVQGEDGTYSMQNGEATQTYGADNPLPGTAWDSLNGTNSPQRSWVTQNGFLPLSAQFNGNVDYTDSVAQQQGYPNLNAFLAAMSGGQMGQIVNDPILGQGYAAPQGAPFDPYKDNLSLKNSESSFGGLLAPYLPAILASGIGSMAGAGAIGGSMGEGGLGGFGSFLEANDAAMAGSGAGWLGTAGYSPFAAGLSTDLGAASTIGGFASGAGLFGDIGLPGSNVDPFSFNPAQTSAGSSPFSFDTGMNSGVNGNPLQQSWNQPITQSAPAASSGGFAPPSTPPMDMNSLFQKYGMDGARSIMNYLQNQNLSNNATKAGQAAANTMGDPRRAAFLNEAQQIAQGNLGAGGTAIKAAVDAQAQARYAKYGYGGTETSRADVMLAQELAKYGNDRLNALLGYTGANQNNAQVAYMAARDSMAFATQSYQGFTALAAKIGSDAGARATISQAATDLGASIMSFFS